MIEKKQTVFYSLIIILVLLISACANQGSADVSAPSDSDSTSAMPAGEMPEGAPPEDMPADGAPTEGGASTSEAIETAGPTAVPVITIDEAMPQASYEEEAMTEPDEDSLNIDSVFTLGNRTYNKTHEDIDATEDDQSAALVTKGGSLIVGYANVTTSGNTSSIENSLFFGQNAAILGKEDSTLQVLYSSVTTSGTGASGVFATSEETTATLLDDSIDTSGDYAPAVFVNELASMKVTNVDMTTSGANSPAIAIGSTGGTITVADSSAATSGINSPAILSKGDIDVSNTVLSTKASEALVIQSNHSVKLTDSQITCEAENTPCVTIYQDNSGDNSDEGSLIISGGSLDYTGDGPMIYVTNSTATITFRGVETVSTASGILVNASAGNWGQSGTNGGDVTIKAESQDLEGIITADSSSKVTLILTGDSTFTGAISPDNSARIINISLDATSTWTVTSDSYLSNLDDPDGISDSDVTNIIGNGFIVYYNKNANTSLHGKIYNLSGGGYLKPLN